METNANPIKRCRKCKSVLFDDGQCPRCSFVPKTGKLPHGGLHRSRAIFKAFNCDNEDDYGEDSGPDSVHHEMGQLHVFGRGKEDSHGS